MVHAIIGLRVLVVLALVHNIFSQQHTILNGQVAYGNVEHRSYTENVKLSSYGHHVQLPQVLPLKPPGTTETRIIKHPDEKIVHHPSPIYVNRPPTFVTINHPDIIIEPNPVVYHKPAAVVRSPVVYRNLPRKIQYRQVVKNIVQPIERKVVLEDKRRPAPQSHIFTQKVVTTRQQPSLQPQYFLTQESDASNDARECVEAEQENTRSRTNIVYQQNVNEQDQQEIIPVSIGDKGEVMDDNRPLDFTPIYYRQSFPQKQLVSSNVCK